MSCRPRPQKSWRKDIGSLVVMEHGDPVGMLDVSRSDVCGENGGTIAPLVRTAMDDHPLTCTSERPSWTRSAA
jgi:hypothetical protein